MLSFSAGVVAEPLMALTPDQPPEAVQLVAPVDDQVTFEVSPLLIVVGLAVKCTVGAVAELTVTVVDCLALPPRPVQVKA